MSTLSVTSTGTMTYCVFASVRDLALVEALLRAVTKVLAF